jgi:hypothetical protein
VKKAGKTEGRPPPFLLSLRVDGRNKSHIHLLLPEWEIVGGTTGPPDSADRLVTRSVISGAAREIGSERLPGGCNRCQK